MNRIVALTSGTTQHYDVADDAPAAVGSIIRDAEIASGGRLSAESSAHDARKQLDTATGRWAGAR